MSQSCPDRHSLMASDIEHVLVFFFLYLLAASIAMAENFLFRFMTYFLFGC